MHTTKETSTFRHRQAMKRRAQRNTLFTPSSSKRRRYPVAPEGDQEEQTKGGPESREETMVDDDIAADDLADNDLADDDLADNEFNDDDFTDDDEGCEDDTLNKSYGLKDDEAFWWAFNEDSHNLDLHDNAVCNKIRNGWNIEKSYLSTTSTDHIPSPPSNDLLREMQQEKRDDGLELCTKTLKFKLWIARLAGGLKSDDTLRIRYAPSLQRIERDKKAEEAREKVRVHNERVDFLSSIGYPPPQFPSREEAEKLMQREFAKISQSLLQKYGS